MHHLVLDIGISHSFLLWPRLSGNIVSKLLSLTSLKLLQTKRKKWYLGMGRKYTTFLKMAMQCTIENFNIFKKWHLRKIGSSGIRLRRLLTEEEIEKERTVTTTVGFPMTVNGDVQLMWAPFGMDSWLLLQWLQDRTLKDRILKSNLAPASGPFYFLTLHFPGWTKSHV